MKMKLSHFISNKMEEILVEWEAFAKTLYPESSKMTSAGLRDHAGGMLQAIAQDLLTSQTAKEQSSKSKGQDEPSEGAPLTASQTHALLRAQGGLEIKQLVSEFRALRASVLRLWIESQPLDLAGLQDVMRFNEAIDQALAESVAYFSEKTNEPRNLLLELLGSRQA